MNHFQLFLNQFKRYYQALRFCLAVSMGILAFYSYSIVNNVVRDDALKENIFLGLDILLLFLLATAALVSFVYYVFIYLPRKIRFSGFSWQLIRKVMYQGGKDFILFIPKFWGSWINSWQTTQRKLRILIRKTDPLSDQINQLILEEGFSHPLKIAQKHFKKLKDYEKWWKFLPMAGLLTAIALRLSLSWAYVVTACLWFLDCYLPLCLSLKAKKKYLRFYKKFYLDILIPLGVLGLLIFGLVTVDGYGQKSIFFAFYFILYGSLFIHFAHSLRRSIRKAERGHEGQHLTELYLLDHNSLVYQKEIDIRDEQGYKQGDIDFSLCYRQLNFLLEVKHFVGTVYIRQEEIEGFLQPMLRRRYRTTRSGRRNRNRNHQPFPSFDRETCPVQKFLADARWFQREWFLEREPICIFVFTHESVVLNIDEQYRVGEFFRFNGAWFVRLNQLDDLLQYLSL